MNKNELDLDQLKQCFEWIDGKYYLPSHLGKEMIKEIEHLRDVLWLKERVEKVTNAMIKEHSKKVKDLFPLENTAGYGQLCELVLKFEEALKQIAGISDISPLRESELMRDVARKALN